MYLFSISLAIAASIAYHLFQKETPTTVHPVLSLLVTYATAAVISVLLLPVLPSEIGFMASFKRLNWASVALGAAIVGLELGFLLAYRAGWNISVGALVVNAAAALLLLPLGLLIYKEQLSPVNGAGIVLALVGLVLINWK